MPTKIAINTIHGRFSLSPELQRLYVAESAAQHRTGWSIYCVPRDDALLIRLIERLGLRKAGGVVSRLKIVEVPDDVGEWEIVDDDGKEKVVETRAREWE